MHHQLVEWLDRAVENFLPFRCPLVEGRRLSSSQILRGLYTVLVAPSGHLRQSFSFPDVLLSICVGRYPVTRLTFITWRAGKLFGARSIYLAPASKVSLISTLSGCSHRGWQQLLAAQLLRISTLARLRILILILMTEIVLFRLAQCEKLRWELYRYHSVAL